MGKILTAFMSIIIVIAAWLTHIVFCLKFAMWGFLIAGAIFVPIGVIHGIGLWFGVFGH